MNLIVLREEAQQQAVRKWFDWIHDEKQRGERARLRRCNTMDEIILQKGFYRLCLPLPELEKYSLIGLALVAGLLVWVKVPTDSSLAEFLGMEKGHSKKQNKQHKNPTFSELRFQRLLASDMPEDFFQAMRRAIIQGGEKANVTELADQILHWYQQNQHPDWYRGQRQWQYRFAKPYYTQIK